jgi:AmmeMemoRadiSam system protein B
MALKAKKLFKLGLGTLVIALAIVAGAILLKTSGSGVSKPIARPSAAPGFHNAYYMERAFYRDFDNSTTQARADISYGGIVSHHFYVEKNIGDFYLQMANQKPSVVVVIGPNHFNAGKANIQTSQFGYKTPYGQLLSDNKDIQKLIDVHLAVEEEASFELEHSISVEVGFIKKVFPDAAILPIIIKKSASLAEVDALEKKLEEILPTDALVVGSVDFSHHQDRIVSDFHDQKSISAIQGFDYPEIQKLEIDSPFSIRTVLKYMQFRGAQKMRYERTNQAEVSRSLDSQDVTSYLFAQFYKGGVEPSESINFLNFGDIMFDRQVKEDLLANKNPFEKIGGVEGNFLKGTDFNIANLEGPISITDHCQTKPINFEFLPQTAQLIKDNKFNLLNMANNHSFDCYFKGEQDTAKYLQEQGIEYFGADDLKQTALTKKVADKTVTFVGVYAVSEKVDAKRYAQIIKQAKTTSDFVVVNIHWGIEYKKLPSDQQIKLAHLFIDNGADVIIGHHPHVVQTIEIYKNKVIFYSLGNFIFDQVGVEQNLGLGVGVNMATDKFSYYLFPTQIVKRQPQLAPYSQAKLVCAQLLKNISQKDVCEFDLMTK